MANIHISKDGKPRPCRAKPGNCKLASNGAHYSSMEEALAATGQEAPVKKRRSRRGLSETVQKEMREAVSADCIAYYQKAYYDYQKKNITEDKIAEINQWSTALVESIDGYMSENPYPVLKGKNPTWAQESDLEYKKREWLRGVANRYAEKVGPEAVRSYGLTDALGDGVIAGNHYDTGSLHRVLFRFGIADAGVNPNKNYLDPDKYDTSTKEERWKNLLTRTALKSGSPVANGNTYYGWHDSNASRHLSSCEVTHVSEVDENDSWDEFAGTFATSDDYKHGILLKGCHCACKRWTGNIRSQNDGLKESLQDILETAGLL